MDGVGVEIGVAGAVSPLREGGCLTVAAVVVDVVDPRAPQPHHSTCTREMSTVSEPLLPSRHQQTTSHNHHTLAWNDVQGVCGPQQEAKSGPESGVGRGMCGGRGVQRTTFGVACTPWIWACVLPWSGSPEKECLLL